ncbi:MAG: hypothetical protein FWB80_14190 [Defluviitaleaceae bacterium]|nr:hypothetical protein [Defluviitaleaceae bacterium]
MENGNLLKTFIKYVGLNLVGLVTSTIVILVDYVFVSMAMGWPQLHLPCLCIPSFLQSE